MLKLCKEGLQLLHQDGECRVSVAVAVSADKERLTEVAQPRHHQFRVCERVYGIRVGMCTEPAAL